MTDFIFCKTSIALCGIVNDQIDDTTSRALESMMYENELALTAFLFDLLMKLVADIPDEQLTVQPFPGMNHPAWILGHLAVAYDYAGKCMGLPLKLIR